jgi:GDPmannose 4,6-dehydratase
VTRKIVKTACKIAKGQCSELVLGDISIERDWGWAPEYVEAMWKMLQQENPDDYVVCTGTTHTVREFCEAAFNHVGLNYEDYVLQDPRFYRPAEVDLLVGNPQKAKDKLGWQPKISLEALVQMMVDADLQMLGKEIL